MEEPRKGMAPNSSKKATSASLDDDFGKDFLTSWKSTNFGNDVMDFDVETSEGKGKGKGKGKTFSFGKLDDFDLDADFDKLPSFKMDMSDLDISSPIKKNNTKPSTEKSLKDSLHGKDKETKSFSFSFDFDDLGKFDLDSHLTIKEKEASQREPSTVELGLNKTQKGELLTEIMDIPKIDSDKAPSKPETSSATSRPPSTEERTSKLPSCDLSNESDRSTRRRFSVPSLSGSSKYNVAQVAQLHSAKGNYDNKTDSSVQSLESHPQLMRSASPVTSSNNLDNVSGACSSDGGLSKNKDSTTLSSQNESGRNSVEVKEVGVEKGLYSTATTSAAQRDLKLNARQEKEISSLLYKPRPNSALTSEQPGDSNMRTKLLNSDSKDLERQSYINDTHAKSSLITETEKASKIRASVLIGNEPETGNKALSTLKNTDDCLPTNNASLKSEKQTVMSNPSTLRLTKMNQISPSAAPESDLKSAKSREINKAPSQLPTPLLPNSASKRKHALLSPSLKRKVVENSISDPFIPLKRISSSLAETRNSPTVALKLICNSPLESRKSPEIALKSGTEMVTGSESAEAITDNLKSPNCANQTILGTADFGIPLLVLENNGNVEKAEAISKELGDISSMLKKKEKEAKELLVRTIVSNNKLLMLNHPIYADKLSSLERFASTLRAKHF